MAVSLTAIAPVQAQGAADAMVRLLESGRLPEARLGTVVEMIASRGNAENLGVLLQKATQENGFSPEIKLQTLQALRDASQSRNVVPAGDLSAITQLLSSEEPLLATLAVELAGLWQVEAAAKPLAQIALDPTRPLDVRRLAIGSVVEIGGDTADQTVVKLTAADQPLTVRYLGVAALTEINLRHAAQVAAEVLVEADTTTDPANMIDAFLAQQQGPSALATALQGKDLSVDVAKMCLRQMYAVGRSDQQLVDVLSEAAGIDNNPDPLTEEQLKAMVAQVWEEGDPARGEEVFRRPELSCFKCHAISGAGGDIGPDLSPVGATSPADYIINSILYPEMAVKEAYLMRSILTIDGKVYQGVVVDENDDRVVMKDANGKNIVIPADDIEAEKEGGSLMPKGLANFLTDEEFIDLVRYVSELGKPGPYGVRSEPTIQRWRVLKNVPPAWQEAVPTTGEFETTVASTPASAWEPAYGKVNGDLPLDELAYVDSPVLYLKASIEVVAAGEIGVELSQQAGLHVWISDDLFRGDETIRTQLPAGTHEIYFRVDTTQLNAPTLRAVVRRPQGSTAQFTVVGGP